jgi:hypothetical protein
MASRVDYVAEGELLIGEDLDHEIEIILASSTVDPVTGAPLPRAAWIPIDVTGVVFRYVLRRERNSPDPPLIDIACTVVGIYNANVLLNTQRVRARLTDDHTAVAVLGDLGGLFWYSFKRTTDGAERIVMFGQKRFARATQT